MDGMGIVWCSATITGEATRVSTSNEGTLSSMGASSSPSVFFGSVTLRRALVDDFQVYTASRTRIRASVVAISPGDQCTPSNLESIAMLGNLFA